jgi:AcrR family transcriptional regulator
VADIDNPRLLSELPLAAGSQTESSRLRSKVQRQTARRALLDAFAELVLSRRYQDVGVGRIAATAGVARSTFYYHFRAKDQLLIENLRPMLSALAQLAVATDITRDAEYWVAHVWEYRTRARRIFEGSTGRKIADALALELLPLLRSGLVNRAGADPSALHADQIAGSMVGILRGWVFRRATATPSTVTRMLWSGARALASAGVVSESPALR